MTYFELKKYIKNTLPPECGECADFEAGKIICFAADIDSARLFAELSEKAPAEVENKCGEILERRINGEPLEYILGYTEFFGLRLKVTSDVLIPRADTEAVCEKALGAIPHGAHIADICCGSGNIACAILSRTDASADLFDISEGAIGVASENIEALGYRSRARTLCRDVFSDGLFSGCEKYDMIISNPPYIKTEVIDTLSREVRREPYSALDGGGDGLLFYRRLLKVCPGMLKKDGVIVFEYGYDQSGDIASLCGSHGFDCTLFKDYGGNFRGCIARRRV